MFVCHLNDNRGINIILITLYKIIAAVVDKHINKRDENVCFGGSGECTALEDSRGEEVR